MATPDFALATAETVEAPRHALARQLVDDGSPSPARPFIPRAALVAGSTPHLSSETHALLRRRLRVVALLLATGFAAFIVWCIINAFASPSSWNAFGPLFYTHVGITVMLGLLAWKLCAKCTYSLGWLRVAELLVFGAPAAFFVALNYTQITFAAKHPEFERIPSIVSGWMLLIFCFAKFIPNTWRRAASVIFAFAAAPMVINLVAYLRVPEVKSLVDNPEFAGMMTEQGLKMLMTAMVGIVGVQSINALRTEAFAAKQLGQYRLKKLLGAGGMGEVYLAEHQMMKRPCAVKVIRPEKAGDPQVLARFEREVRATAKLSHWNSIEIYDYGRTEDGTFYYVMEFLPGHNLNELIDRTGPLPANRLVYLLRQVCDALAEAHGQGLVHRDIKPANIFCAYRGGIFDVAKILDFGLAKPLSDATDSGLTQEGSITGSPLFMSPEQATSSDSVDARSDIYSLGAVMYYMSTGKAPFHYDSPLKVMIAHASEDPEPPRLLNADLPGELEEIILRSLEKRPDDRFQSITDLRDALDRVPVDSDWTAREAAEWWSCNGCPQRKAMAAEAVELAAV